MAAVKARQVGEAFLQGVLAKVQDPDKKARLEAALKVDEFVEELGEGAMRRSDYSRRMDELKAQDASIQKTAREQQEWWQANQPLVELGKKVATSGRPVAAAPAAAPQQDQDPASPGVISPAPVQGITAVQLNQALQTFGNQTVQFQITLDALRKQHYDRYKELLDTAQVVAHAQKTGMNLEQAYSDLTAERRREFEEQSIQERIAQGVREQLDKMGAAAPPYPVANMEPDILSAIKDAEEYGPAAAARDYRMGKF